jgi:hypothetical protein
MTRLISKVPPFDTAWLAGERLIVVPVEAITGIGAIKNIPMIARLIMADKIILTFFVNNI